jgi:hypothetical protein
MSRTHEEIDGATAAVRTVKPSALPLIPWLIAVALLDAIVAVGFVWHPNK